MRVSNIIIFQTRNVSRDTYKIMGKWKDSTGITCWTDKLYNFQDICSVSKCLQSRILLKKKHADGEKRI